MKWIIVTGDSGGLGNVIVEKILLEMEYGVIGISRSKGEGVSRLLLQYPERYIHIDFDLSLTKQIKALYLDKIKSIGRMYGLVNNSANAYDDIATNISFERLDLMFRVNVYSPMFLTKYAIRDMLLTNTKGSIVHISSVSAHTGYKGLSIYAATKGALEAFSKGLAREWGSRGIRSNCVAPGFMETSISAALSEDQKNKIYQRSSLKKAIDISSVAQTVTFLLSEKSASITGSVIHNDGGTL